MTPPPGTLRDHTKPGWAIEDEDAQLAALDALEAAALVVLDVVLARLAHHHDTNTALALRGLGTLASREGLTRLAHYRGTDEHGRPRAGGDDHLHAAAAADVWAVLDTLVAVPVDGPPQLRPPAPFPPLAALALDELHAAAVALDRANSRRGAKLTRSTRTMAPRRPRRT